MRSILSKIKNALVLDNSKNKNSPLPWIIILWATGIFGLYVFYTLWDNIPEILALLNKIKGALF